MYRLLTATAIFIVKDATGPNHDGLELEVIDPEGDRLAYVESLDAAADLIGNLTDYPPLKVD